MSINRAALLLGAFAVLQRLRGKSVRPVAAVGVFVAVFRVLRRLLRSAGKKGAQKNSAALEALPGFGAALAALAVERSFASPLWVIWLWVRVARFSSPPVPHAELVTGSLAAGYNLSTYLWDHTRLAPAYAQFLSQCGGSGNLGLSAIEAIRLTPNTDRLHQFCHIIHSGESCNRFAINTLLRGAFFGAKIQIPLHLITHAAKFKSASAAATLTSLLRAVLFLGVYPASAMLIICNWWKITGESKKFLSFSSPFFLLCQDARASDRRR